jgi:hypothetical protein
MEYARTTKGKARLSGYRETTVKHSRARKRPALPRNRIMDWFTLFSCLSIALPIVWFLSE